MSEYVNSKCLKSGMTMEESIKAYSDMAAEFDEYVAGIKYIAPRKAAELAADFFHEKSNIKVLDLACGTGLVAEGLKELGFTNIDGMEPSEGMVEIAKSKGLYNKFFTTPLGVGDARLPVEDNFYDIATLCGGMGQNMMPCAGLHEMIRLVKPGGYIINIFREEILTKVDEYKDRLEPLMESLEKEGKWIRLTREVYPEYQVDKVGIINVHRIC